MLRYPQAFVLCEPGCHGAMLVPLLEHKTSRVVPLENERSPFPIWGYDCGEAKGK